MSSIISKRKLNEAIISRKVYKDSKDTVLISINSGFEVVVLDSNNNLKHARKNKPEKFQGLAAVLENIRKEMSNISSQVLCPTNSCERKESVHYFDPCEEVFIPHGLIVRSSFLTLEEIQTGTYVQPPACHFDFRGYFRECEQEYEPIPSNTIFLKQMKNTPYFGLFSFILEVQKEQKHGIPLNPYCETSSLFSKIPGKINTTYQKSDLLKIN